MFDYMPQKFHFFVFLLLSYHQMVKPEKNGLVFPTVDGKDETTPIDPGSHSIAICFR